MTESFRRLDVRCPVCHRPPALRASEQEVAAKRRHPADYVVSSYECRWCGERYIITAKAFHNAERDAA